MLPNGFDDDGGSADSAPSAVWCAKFQHSSYWKVAGMAVMHSAYRGAHDVALHAGARYLSLPVY